MNAISNTAPTETTVGRKDRPHLLVSVVNSTTLKAACISRGILKAEVLVGVNDGGYLLGHVTLFNSGDPRFDLAGWARKLIGDTLSCEHAERILKA